MPSFADMLAQHHQVMQATESLIPEMEKAAQLIVDALKAGNKVMLCGNGGSAADAQHIAAEIVGRFETERQALPAIALTTDTSILTAVGNDYGYDAVFSRQVEGLGQSGDVLLAYSTSGNSGNVLRAVEAAQNKGIKIVALSGKGGGKLAAFADANLCVPSDTTARIQEAHAFIGHALCAAVDQAY